MIVYIYNDMFFNKVNLPIKISGVYPLYINERIFLGNIEEKNGLWVYSISDNVSFKDAPVSEVKENTSFVLVDKTTKFNYYIYVTKTYSESTYRYNLLANQFTIGNAQTCDISYQFKDIEKKEEVITISTVGDKLVLKTDSRFAFVNGKRIAEKTLDVGDYLFYYGLRLIFVGKEIIINGTNTSSIVINQTAFNSLGELNAPINEYDANADEDIPLFGKQDYFFKAPRFYTGTVKETVKINEPPAPMKKDETSSLLVYGPQFTMLCTSGISLYSIIDSYNSGGLTTKKLIISLLTMGITISSALLWPAITRAFTKKRNKKYEEKRQKKYKEYLDSKSNELEQIVNKQKQALIENSPSLDKCKLIIETRT